MRTSSDSVSMADGPAAPPAQEVAVDMRDPAWAVAGVGDVEVLCRRCARAAVGAAVEAAAAPAADWELAIVLADDAFVRALNRDWRGIDRPTNVLSFAAGDDVEDGGNGPQQLGPRLLGDVVIARETVVAEAAAAGKGLDDHLSHLVVHGVLHLLGYDHGDDAAAGEMEALEVAVLATLGVGDPYAAQAGASDGNGSAEPRST